MRREQGKEEDMRADTLTIDRPLAIETEKAVPTKWNRFLERLTHLLQNHFESEWERKTGLPWKEWSTWGEGRQSDEKAQKAEHPLMYSH